MACEKYEKKQIVVLVYLFGLTLVYFSCKYKSKIKSDERLYCLSFATCSARI